MAKNPHGKMRTKDNPYAIITNDNWPGWEWRVLKRYQSAEKEKSNPHARWMVAVKSPHTYGNYEMGDVYVTEIPGMSLGIDLDAING